MEPGSADHRLALVIDPDTACRGSIRRMLAALGFDVVQAANGLVGLELIQRLPESFGLVLTDLDLPGVPGVVVVETLQRFRPGLPVVCMGRSAAVAAAPATGCLLKPLDAGELKAQIESVLAGTRSHWDGDRSVAAQEAVLRAEARYAQGNSLVEAALELARGFRED